MGQKYQVRWGLATPVFDALSEPQQNAIIQLKSLIEESSNVEELQAPH
jgi:hypothetical protein